MRAVSSRSGGGISAQDRLGRVWFGTNGDGVYRFSESGVAHFTTADGLFSNVVMALAADEGGSVWVGTEASGLNRIRDDQVDGFGPETGLPDQPVYSILPGGPDHIWVSSARSVARIPKAQLDAIAAKWRERIDPPVSVSIGGGEVSAGTQPAAWKGADGTLWLPTNRGLLNVAPDMIRAETAPPAAKLEEVMIDGRVPPPAATLRVKPGRHHYTFRFTAFDYHEPALVRFRYRLEGFDPDWIDARRERIAHYTNLPPGTYDFRAAAAAPTGPWSGREIRQRVVVEPAFWQTAGFRVAAALAVAGLVLAAFQLRHRSLVRRRDELERLVARRTDQLRKQGEEREAVLRSLRESEQRVSLAAAAGRVAMWEWQPEAGIRFPRYFAGKRGAEARMGRATGRPISLRSRSVTRGRGRARRAGGPGRRGGTPR